MTEWPDVPEPKRRDGPVNKYTAKYSKNFRPVVHEADFLPIKNPRHCPYCEYKAPTKPGLKLHVNDCHEFMTWFLCPVDDCQKPFLAYYGMENHCKKWHNMKQFGNKEDYQITDKDVIHGLRKEHINNKVYCNDRREKKERAFKQRPY